MCSGGGRSLHDGNLDKLRIAGFLSIYLFLSVEFYSGFIISFSDVVFSLDFILFRIIVILK